MRAAQQAHRLGGFGGGVLDGLRFVQHDVVEFDFGQLGRIAPQRAIGGQHQVVLPDQRGVARQAGVVQHAQLRREAHRFLRSS